MIAGEGETLDAIGEGRVRLLQRRDGYRFNLDSVLLAAFAVDGLDANRPLRMVDLGTGCGVVALVVRAWRPTWNVRGIERQPVLADLARRNVELNALPIEIVEADWRAIDRPTDRADLVACNPPYFDAGEGHVPPDEEIAGARFALHGGVFEAAKAARRIGTDRVRLRVIFPAARLAPLLVALSEAKLAPSRLRPVHARTGDDAYAVLVEARASWNGPLQVEPALVVQGDAERFSPEVQRILSHDGPAAPPRA